MACIYYTTIQPFRITPAVSSRPICSAAASLAADRGCWSIWQAFVIEIVIEISIAISWLWFYITGSIHGINNIGRSRTGTMLVVMMRMPRHCRCRLFVMLMRLLLRWNCLLLLLHLNLRTWWQENGRSERNRYCSSKWQHHQRSGHLSWQWIRCWGSNCD